MKRDIDLIEIFLNKYGPEVGHIYEVKEWPEDKERNKPAVEAIACDENGNTLAIEHTLIQPFLGERDDAQPFRKILEPLECNTSLIVPGVHITICLPVGAIPKGADWQEINLKITDWLYKEKNFLPENDSWHKIPNLTFELRLKVVKMSMDSEYLGKIHVARTGSPDTFEQVIRKALSQKLPKLTSTHADRRILLLEQNSLLQSPTQFRQTIGPLEMDFPYLTKVDEIWVVDTVAWESEGVTFYNQIWPSDVDVRFVNT